MLSFLFYLQVLHSESFLLSSRICKTFLLNFPLPQQPCNVMHGLCPGSLHRNEASGGEAKPLHRSQGTAELGEPCVSSDTLWVHEEGHAAYCSAASTTGTANTWALLCQHFSLLTWSGRSRMRDNLILPYPLSLVEKTPINGIFPIIFNYSGQVFCGQYLIASSVWTPGTFFRLVLGTIKETGIFSLMDSKCKNKNDPR